MAGQPLLRVSGIVKEFPGVRALKGVSFDLAPGEVHALLGENGAGKSTLIKIMSGVYDPDAGEVQVDGRPVSIHSPRAAMDLKIATIQQEFSLVMDMTVTENFFLGKELVHGSGKIGLLRRMEMTAACAAALQRIASNIDPRALIRDLSPADRQLVQIARAVFAGARIVLMDEPTSALTDREKERLFEIVRSLKADGVGIIYISHHLEEIHRIADRITILRDGEDVASGPASEMSISDIIRHMVGRDINTLFPKTAVERGAEALRVDGFTKAGQFQGIDLTLHRGEIIGIYGLVGSGRTELLRAIFGLEKPDRGSIYLERQRMGQWTPKLALKHGIGFLPEERKTQGLFLTHSVRVNMSLSALGRFTGAFGRINQRLERNTVAQFVERLRVKTPHLEQEIGAPSGGNQQKVIIGRLLCSTVKVFLMDEPTRGVDVGAKVEIYQLISQLANEGAAILMVSSELPEIMGLSDRILVLSRGRLTAEFTRAEATEEKISQAAFSVEAAALAT